MIIQAVRCKLQKYILSGRNIRAGFIISLTPQCTSQISTSSLNCWRPLAITIMYVKLIFPNKWINEVWQLFDKFLFLFSLIKLVGNISKSFFNQLPGIAEFKTKYCYVNSLFSVCSNVPLTIHVVWITIWPPWGWYVAWARRCDNHRGSWAWSHTTNAIRIMRGWNDWKIAKLVSILYCYYYLIM